MMEISKRRSKHDESEGSEEQTAKAQARKEAGTNMSLCHRTTPYPRSRLLRVRRLGDTSLGALLASLWDGGHDACPPRGTALV